MLRPIIRDGNGDTVTGLAFNTSGFSISVYRPSDTDWDVQTLVAGGTKGTYTANTIVEIGAGMYQWSVPNDCIVAGDITSVRIVPPGEPPIYDIIEASGSTNITGGTVTLPDQLTPTGAPFQIIQGDDYTGSRAVRYDLSTSGNLDGLDVLFTCKKDQSTGFTFRFPLEGTEDSYYFNFDITTAQSEALATGRYSLIIRVEHATDEEQTIARGFCDVLPFATVTPIVDS